MRRSALLLLALASCSGSSRKEPTRTEEPVTRVDPQSSNPVRTDELGTDRTRPVAKTLEWPNVSTSDQAVYLGGEVVIDRIRREDAEDMYGVYVRLGNRSTQVQKIEYRILFFGANRNRLLGVHEEYRSAILEPRGVREVSDACALHGAVGFQLLVRRTGTQDEGLPGNPGVKPK